MPRSMTAFGSAKKGALQVEIHSVNRKGLDVQVMLPKNKLSLDVFCRKLIGEEIHRGQVTVRIAFDEGEDVFSETNFLKKLKVKWDKVASDLGFKEASLEFLVARSKEEVSFSSFSEEDLKGVILEALHSFIVMREKEGDHLLKDILSQLAQIKSHLKEIEAKIPFYEEKQIEKLKQALKDLSGVSDEEKILKETSSYIKKMDVHEEMIRLHSHMSQFEEKICGKDKNIGRLLDVLIQEMGREINTLMAKMEDTEITKLAIKIKSAINKMQEQVQNIE